VGVSPIFGPCDGEISHNEIEDARRKDLTAGDDLLLQTTLGCGDLIELRAAAADRA
jgi:hypothetical protein